MENAVLLKKISTASIEDAAAYRQQYNANKTRIDRLKGELAEWKKKQSDYAQQSRMPQTTTAWRRMTITAYRPSCRTARRHTVLLGRTAEHGTATRMYAKRPCRISTVSSHSGYGLHCPQAEIISRHKIHRAIIQIKWELTSEYTDTHVADVLTIDPGLSDAEKANW